MYRNLQLFKVQSIRNYILQALHGTSKMQYLYVSLRSHSRRNIKFIRAKDSGLGNETVFADMTMFQCKYEVTKVVSICTKSSLGQTIQNLRIYEGETYQAQLLSNYLFAIYDA